MPFNFWGFPFAKSSPGPSWLDPFSKSQKSLWLTISLEIYMNLWPCTTSHFLQAGENWVRQGGRMAVESQHNCLISLPPHQTLTLHLLQAVSARLRNSSCSAGETCKVQCPSLWTEFWHHLIVSLRSKNMYDTIHKLRADTKDYRIWLLNQIKGLPCTRLSPEPAPSYLAWKDWARVPLFNVTTHRKITKLFMERNFSKTMCWICEEWMLCHPMGVQRGRRISITLWPGFPTVI